MSDFLQFEDEVINGTPKYNITSNGDGTSSITLANEVIQQGTPLNRATLDSINNVMGYHTLPYTQETQSGTAVLTNGNYTYTNNEVQIPNTMNYNIKALKGTHYADIVIIESNYFQMADGNQIFVPSNVTSFEIFGYGRAVEGSNDGITWHSWYTPTTTWISKNNDYRYYRSNNTTSSPIRFRNFIGSSVKNKFTYSKTINADKQILNAYIDFGEGAVIDNTLNGKSIDTLLQSNKYYELMFDEPNDRFIAYETRV